MQSPSRQARVFVSFKATYEVNLKVVFTPSVFLGKMGIRKGLLGDQ